MFNHNKPLSRRPNKTEAGDKALITKIQDFQSKRHKGKPKQVHLTPQTDVNITDIKRIFSTTWRENKTNFMSVRSELDSLVNTHECFTVTQRTQSQEKILTMAHQDKVSRTVFHDIHARLPKESPFKGVTFPRCVVMGSSGLLANSHCGSEIDNADYVFR
ncbi:putative alpha-2,8-sialyltransferase 8F-like [Apostichopus japonicus]|uniref:Putative alpha-2,8-sialyltransferase 8F-like n=2 Tax=Stichopus japonicus TaxID=307972 RepID=A0A2G8JBC8_STIJA|nr:putative alpha-2,8-sialyltransferase 8F-like [Apostichopus japonicus]